MDREKRIGALWVHETKNGKKFLAGKVGEKDIIVFKDNFKEEGSKKPDWIIYESDGQPNKSSV